MSHEDRGLEILPVQRRELLALATAPLALAVLGTPALSATEPQDKAASSPYGLEISSEFPYEKKRVRVKRTEMAYVDEGSGPTLLFLHGNPTSSYLWRNIFPYVLKTGYRVVAPDLIGMGDSSKADIAYSFSDHAAYLDKFIVALRLQGFILVVHDWGPVLGMRHARFNPADLRGLVFMEAIIPPAMSVPSLEAMDEPMTSLFRDLRTEGIGEEMVPENNFFVEEILPKMGVARDLTKAEMVHYRATLPDPGKPPAHSAVAARAADRRRIHAGPRRGLGECHLAARFAAAKALLLRRAKRPQSAAGRRLAGGQCAEHRDPFPGFWRALPAGRSPGSDWQRHCRLATSNPKILVILIFL